MGKAMDDAIKAELEAVAERNRDGLTLTKLELEALIFAVSDSQRKARRDCDLVRDDYKNLLRIALGKLQDEHIRMTEDLQKSDRN